MRPHRQRSGWNSTIRSLHDPVVPVRAGHGSHSPSRSCPWQSGPVATGRVRLRQRLAAAATGAGCRRSRGNRWSSTPTAASPWPSSCWPSATALTAFRTPDASRNVRLFAAAGCRRNRGPERDRRLRGALGSAGRDRHPHLTAAMLFLAFAVDDPGGGRRATGAPHWLAELGGLPRRTADRPFAIVASLARRDRLGAGHFRRIDQRLRRVRLRHVAALRRGR